MDKKILLITGNKGFIGMNFIEYLNGDGKYLLDNYDGVAMIDACQLKSEDGMSWWVEAKAPFLDSDKFIVDISSDINTLFFTDHLKKIEDKFGKATYTILNFASKSHVDESISNPFGLYVDNAVMLPNLIHGIGIENIEKFYHIRTDEEYGHLTSVDAEPFKVWDKLNPRNPYAASKASQTVFLQSLQHTFGLDVSFFVLANQFGKYQHYSKMIPASIKRVFDNEPIKVYGTGENYREWTFVEDTVKEIGNSIISGVRTGGVCHISNPKSVISNNELIELLTKEIAKYGFKPEIEYIEDRKGHDFCYKLKPSINTDNFKSVEEGLEETVKYYLGIWK